MKYEPTPIDTNDITLPSDILELAEILAKNTHDVWSTQRIKEGWQYGPARNDEKKQHPGLVGYEELPESEKAYDRNTAFETLKVLVKLGYRIEK